MFRSAGKIFHSLWVLSVVIMAVIADIQGLFDGTWLDLGMSFASILILVWLALFAIGVSRGEPNP